MKAREVELQGEGRTIEGYLAEPETKDAPWNKPGLVDKLTAGSYGRVGVKCHGLAVGSTVLDRGPAVQRSRS